MGKKWEKTYLASQEKSSTDRALDSELAALAWDPGASEPLWVWISLSARWRETQLSSQGCCEAKLSEIMLVQAFGTG